MNTALYRNEIRRMTRTHTLAGLMAFFVLFGAASPVLVFLLPDLLAAMEGMEGVQPGMADLMPEATPVAAIGSYVENGQTLGVLFVLLVAAGALSLDGSTGRSTFYRVRVAGPAALVLPRFAVPAVAAVAAHTAGAVVAWATTLLLIGELPLGATLAGALFTGLFLVFAVAVTAVVAARARGLLPTVGFSVAALVVLVLLGQLPVVGEWSPTALFAAQAALPGGAPVADFLPAAAGALVGTAALLALAVRGFGAREV
ncbi:ABC transporter [Nocardiopsis sp. CA-288880]|uniref:ABC transporter n=1 Tax=Nocardiopsis sp. CA-288880 TaxID=3239995 RepID=UPI003D988E3B